MSDQAKQDQGGGYALQTALVNLFPSHVPPPSHSPKQLCSTSPKFLGGGDTGNKTVAAKERFNLLLVAVQARGLMVGGLGRIAPACSFGGGGA
ncbi:hypothetical protein Pla52n_14880 [Stieleria varia]|uniref:Uncharacterized protein n=1 Tax=Stieleria varia TaxID=2528005 RepID=A0A5C6B0T1_9BACT|nr:hypothetical protein Pla52n_14880 [Stieleria varia]